MRSGKWRDRNDADRRLVRRKISRTDAAQSDRRSRWASLKTVHPDEFETLLINEVQFLAPYTEQEAQQVEEYIHQHLRELYHYLHSLTS